MKEISRRNLMLFHALNTFFAVFAIVLLGGLLEMNNHCKQCGAGTENDFFYWWNGFAIFVILCAFFIGGYAWVSGMGVATK